MRAMRTKRREAILGVYDVPLWRDWLTYLTAVGIVAGFGTVGGGNAIDVMFAVGFQFLLFGMLPGGLRKAWRAIRSNRQVDS